jgi:hypothetical protein
MKKLLIMVENHKRKMRKYSIPFVMLFVSTTAQSSCSKLARAAGMSQNSLENIVTRLVKIESTSGKYNVKNHRSGAYGRYQIMPSTANFYAKKLKIPKYLWKRPYNQDKIFRAIMDDNIKSLKRNGHKVSAFSLYATHQQGAVGFNRIMKNRPLSKRMEKNLRENLPSSLKKVKKSKLRTTWIRYWKNKLG